MTRSPEDDPRTLAGAAVGPGIWLDAVIAIVLFATAYLCGPTYVRAALAGGVIPQFYQVHFGPAVMMACGRPYTSPPTNAVPALDTFLAGQRDTFACDALPSNPPLGPVTGAHVAWRYLISTAGLVWRITGVSWTALVLTMSGIFFGATVALAFALGRLVAGRVLAMVVAGTVLTSPLHLTTLPHLRDYSKVPFLLALCVLLGLFVVAPLRPRRVLVLAAAYGLILAIGTGFRSDVLIAALPLVLAVAFLPGGALSNVRIKAAALAIAAVTFLLGGWPLFGAYTRGGGANMQHVALLGLMSTPFNESLKIAPSMYEVGHAYDDDFAIGMVTDYAARRHHIEEPIPEFDRRYDSAASALIREIITTFPADVLARAYASVLAMATLPTSNSLEASPPPFLAGSLVERFYDERARLLHAAPWIWPAAVALALLVASAASIRIAAYVTLIGLYFAGYPAIQFAERHYVHLTIIIPMALAFLLHRAIGVIRSSPSTRTWGIHEVKLAAARVAAFVLVAAFGLMTPLGLARAYQDWRVTTEIKRRLRAMQQRVDFAARVAGARTMLEMTNLPAASAASDAARIPGATRSEYLVVELGGRRCQSPSVAVRIQYGSSFEDREAFSHTLRVAVPAEDGQSATMLVPAFFRIYPGGQVARFIGFEVPRGDETCIEGISRIVDTKQFGVLFAATLPPDWRSRPLHQKLLKIEPRPVGGDPTYVARPPDLRVTRRLLTTPLALPETLFRADTVRQTSSGGWTMNSGAREPMSYLMQFKSVPATPEGRFVVQGVLHAGGLTIGILRDNRWLLNIPMVEPGPFVVVLAAESSGPVSLVVANNLQVGASSKNDFEINRLGFLATDAPLSNASQ